MLRKVFEEALARGEKISKELSKDILNSKLVADLANSPRFVNAITYVIRSKAELSRAVSERFKGTMEIMNIPTRQQLRSFERRVARLEKELDTIARKHMRGGNSSAAAKTKKPAKKKSVAPAAKPAAAPQPKPKPVKAVTQNKSTPQEVAEREAIQGAAIKRAAAAAEQSAASLTRRTTKPIKNIKPAQNKSQPAAAAIPGRPITVH